MGSSNLLLTDPLVRWAHETPQALALICNEHSLNYQELLSRSCALANTLVDRGVKRSERVGLYLDKSPEAVIAIYGVLLAGAAYVPLDAGAPVQRTAFLVQDCGIKVLISGKAKRRQLAALTQQSPGLDLVIGLADDQVAGALGLSWEEVWKAPERLPETKVTELDLSYIIYTSGSTGSPKGIMHTHYSGMSYAQWAAAEYGLTSKDRVGNHSPFHFDISIFDLFATVVAGGAVVLIPEPVLKMPASYSQLLQDAAVSVLFTVPFALIQLSKLGALPQRKLDKLRWVIFGGEPFPPEQLKILMGSLPLARFDNMYGPAEVNGCTHFTLTGSDFDGNVPIGRPARIADIRVVDGKDNLVPPGETGELLVRTPAKMQGYWRRPDLTEKSTWHGTAVHPVNSAYYRTGDLVRQRPDGVLEFLGRRDRQIKVRGYRVELDEVELALNSNSVVEETAAYLLSRGPGENYIEAQVRLSQPVADAGVEAELLAHAKSSLPGYALPASIRLVSTFPRTTSGKIDRRLVASQAQALVDTGNPEVEQHG